MSATMLRQASVLKPPDFKSPNYKDNNKDGNNNHDNEQFEDSTSELSYLVQTVQDPLIQKLLKLLSIHFIILEEPQNKEDPP